MYGLVAPGTSAKVPFSVAADCNLPVPVHDTVNDIDGVVTTSEGEEPRRRVVISPA